MKPSIHAEMDVLPPRPKFEELQFAMSPTMGMQFAKLFAFEFAAF
jgi:hypothetical protein